MEIGRCQVRSKSESRKENETTNEQSNAKPEQEKRQKVQEQSTARQMVTKLEYEELAATVLKTRSRYMQEVGWQGASLNCEQNSFFTGAL